jgi:hypothetical protein
MTLSISINRIPGDIDLIEQDDIVFAAADHLLAFSKAAWASFFSSGRPSAQFTQAVAGDLDIGERRQGEVTHHARSGLS